MEAEGFAVFYGDVFEWACRLAFVLVGDAGVAEDVAQEALARLQPRFEGIETPRAYLRTVIVNLVRRQMRQSRRVAASTGSPLESPTGHDTVELLEVVRLLPVRQQAVLALRYFEDLSEAETARILGCRPGTVKSLTARALDRLRKELRNERDPDLG